MKVLVTGHRGYIGVEMVPVLRAAGHEVVGLDTGYYDGCDFVSPPDETPELKVDLRDVTAERHAQQQLEQAREAAEAASQAKTAACPSSTSATPAGTPARLGTAMAST